MASAGHALIVPLPIHGHVNPMLQLALHLSSLQFNVSFITTTSTQQAANSALRSSCDDKVPPENIRFVCLEDGNRSSGYDFGGSIHFMVSRRDDLNKLVESAVHQHGPITVNVLDFILLEPFKGLTAFQGAITAGFWTTSAAMLHIVVNINTLLEQGFLPMNNHNKLLTVDSSVIPGISTEICVETDLPEDPLDPAFKSMSKVSASLKSAPMLLVNSFEGLENSSMVALEQQGYTNVVCVGPLLHLPKGLSTTSLVEEADEIFKWLDLQASSSVLYVSFGTMLELHPEQIMEIAFALESSGQPFLWVLRGRSHSDHEIIAGLKNRFGEQGMVVPWSPQVHVLKHSSVGGFLTHCGWNSTLESVSCGVPMIGWPSVGDQFVNSKYVADVWKVGVRINIGVRKNLEGSSRLVSRDEIEKTIRSLMTNREMQLGARKMHDKAEEAALEIGSKLKKCFGK